MKTSEQHGYLNVRLIVRLVPFRGILFWWMVATATCLADSDKSGVSLQSISLPTGPGSLEGLGEKYQPQLNSGACSYQVPIKLPPVRGNAPSLVLEYNSGNGNGPLGLGWTLKTPLIRRQTDKGLPRYGTNDRFCDENAEELVHLADGTYRQKIEGPFIRYRPSTNLASWTGQLPNGATMRFGSSPTSRLDWRGVGTYCWQLDSTTDLNGNITQYSYTQDSQQIYLSSIRYGQHKSQPSKSYVVQLNYSTNRADAFVDCHPRFAVTNRLRLESIILSLGTRRIREWQLAYGTNQGPSMLASVTEYGDDHSLTNQAAIVNRDFFPPALFQYTDSSFATNPSVTTVTLPVSVDFLGHNAEFIDVNHDGLPDILFKDDEGLKTALNPGAGNPWPMAELVTNPPYGGGFRLSDANTRLVDLRGDGKSKLLSAKGGFVGETSSFSFQDFNSPTSLGDAQDFFLSGNLYLTDTSVQFADLNGDGAIDLFQLGDLFTVIINHQADGQPNELLVTTPPPSPFSFQNGWQLADINGDRLLDLVYLGGTDNTGVCLNTGWGQFLPTYWMAGGPEITEVYKAQLVDLNQDGLADLVIVEPNRIRVWLNDQGRAWEPVRFLTEGVPDYTISTAVRFADMNGNGSVDIVWADANNRTLQWLDLFPGGKAFLLNHVQTSMGASFDVKYRSSVEYQVAANGTSNQWTVTSPFPVPVVAETVDGDGLGKYYTNRFDYRNAYYDPMEHQFRGFEQAISISLGQDDQGVPSLVTQYRFDVGMTNEALKGKMLAVEADTLSGAPFYRQTNIWLLRVLPVTPAGDESRVVTFSFQTTKRLEEIELGSETDARTVLERFNYDDYGNLIVHQELGIIDGDSPALPENQRFTATTFALNTNAWIIRTPSRMELSDGHRIVLSRVENYYDDPSFSGTNWGAVTVGNLTMRREWTNAAITGGYITSLRRKYDILGNPTLFLDPLALTPGGSPSPAVGHYREIRYDSILFTYPVSETIHVGNSHSDLIYRAAYDVGLGTVTNSIDFNGNQTTFAYDTFGRLVSLVRPGDSPAYPTVQYRYVLSSEVSAGLINAIETRQLDGVPVDGSDPNSFYFVSRQYVDGLGRKRLTKTEAEPALGSTTPRVVVSGATRFNARERPSQVLNPYFSLSGGSLDALLAYEDIEFPAWQGQFELNGSLVNLGLTQAPVTANSYDATLRAVRVTNADRTFRQTQFGPFRTTTYDENDTDPASPNYQTPTIRYMDGLGRLVRVDETTRLKDDGTPGASLATWSTLYQYDINDQLTKITDSQNNVKTFSYDGLKRKIALNDPDRGVMTYTYDDASNLVKSTDAKGQLITYSYDGVNRILTEDYHDEGLPFSFNYALNPSLPISLDNRPDVTYFYDQAAPVLDNGDGTTSSASNTLGRLAYVWDLAGEEHTSYDARGRVEYVVKRVRDPINTRLVSYRTDFAYDSLDRVKSLIYPDKDSVGYQYNARTLLAQIVGGPSGSIISNLVYFPSGQQGNILYGNGIQTSYGYDSRLRLNSLVTAPSSNPDGPLISFAYALDGVSNIKTIEDNRPGTVVPAGDKRRNTQLYQYDDLYRLTQARYSFNLPNTPQRNDGEIDYHYDRIGNMLDQSSSIPDVDPHTGLSVANLGAMQSGGGTGGRSNRLGRTTTDPPGPHALTAIANPTNGTINRTYSYDPNGNMTTIDGLAATWDFKDRLVALEDATMRAEYVYDFTDRRITKSVTTKSPPSGSLPARVTYPYTTTYVGKHFEVREFDAPTKHVWNGNTRVARVTGTLTPGQRVQRFRVFQGWNLLSVAVTAEKGGAQLALTGETDGIYRWDSTNQAFAVLSPTDTIQAGTVLWLQATTNTTLRAVGMYPGPLPNLRAAPYGKFIPSYGLNPLPITNQSSSLIIWEFAPDLQRWITSFSTQEQLEPSIPPEDYAGRAAFVLATSQIEINGPDTTLAAQFYHQDHLGSSSVLTDVYGSLVHEDSFYPFGVIRNDYVSRSAKDAYTFTQKESDSESDVAYFETRYLNNSLGRFVSVDSLTSTAAMTRYYNPQKINPYSYVESRPLMSVDPQGMEADKSTTGAIPTEPIDEASDIRPSDPNWLKSSPKPYDSFLESLHTTQVFDMGINSGDAADVLAISRESHNRYDYIIAPYENNGGGILETFRQVGQVAHKLYLGGPASPQWAALSGKAVDVTSFSGGGADRLAQNSQYHTEILSERSFGGTTPTTELLGEYTHGRNIGGFLTDVIVGVTTPGLFDNTFNDHESDVTGLNGGRRAAVIGKVFVIRFGAQ